jgi:23S rRNA-/tRNA-specific pseudouridylate synthase
MPERRPLRPRRVVRPNGTEQIDVPGYGAQMRLDAFLARTRLIQAGAVTLDGRRVRPSDRVAEGQRVVYAPAATQNPSDRPRPAPEIALTIVYQDPSMIVPTRPPAMRTGHSSTRSWPSSRTSPTRAASTAQGSSTGSTRTPPA